MDIETIVANSVKNLDEIFPNNPPFMNHVQVINPEIAKFVQMQSYYKNIPWENIYKICKEMNSIPLNSFELVKKELSNCENSRVSKAYQ